MDDLIRQLKSNDVEMKKRYVFKGKIVVNILLVRSDSCFSK